MHRMTRTIRPFARPLALVAASVAMLGLVACNSLDSRFENYEGTWGSPGSAQPVMPGSQGLVEAMQTQDRNTEQLMEIEGVVGTGSSVDENDAPVVVVFTENTDNVDGIPGTVDGVPVRVEVVGKIEALQSKGKTPTVSTASTCLVNRAGRFARPVPIGVSTGHTGVTAGTIGVRVKDKKGALYLLSNNHVFANTNNAVVGDNILQPGPFDGGVNPGDVVATLKSFVPIAYCAGTACVNNRMDAAIASTTAALSDRATPCDGYGTPAKAVANATANLRVKKYGRTTGLTTGVIAAVNVTIQVGYAGGVAQFSGQVYITTPNFVGGGDSGSLIVTESGNKPVALVFAGTSTAAFATPISTVLNQFGVTVDGI